MKNNKKGFTLVELVIVVAVMAILVAVAIPTIGSIAGSATEAVFDSNCRTIESVIKLAEAEAVKNSGTSTGSSTTLEASAIYTALNNAKLGIENDTFYYHPTTGIVDGTNASGAIVIYYTDGVASGTASTPAATTP